VTISSQTTPDVSALHKALAELHDRLDRHEAIVAEGFQALRDDIRALEHQCLQLVDMAEAPIARSPTATQSTAALTVPAGTQPDATAKYEYQSQAEPVPAPRMTDDAQDGPPAPEEFQFAPTTSTEEVDASEFQFHAGPSRDASPEPIRVGPADFVSPAPGDAIDMEQVMFGPDLAANQSLLPDRSSLLQGLYASDAAALTLLGELLVFRGAAPERMPGLLKEIGEAYYGWRGQAADGPDPFRDDLTGWLQRRCEQSGVPNTIELVRPGDRYDSKRHHARQRGVEVSQVGGWVVLRDNGSVYTKATVKLK
jgi:hypothetical protein